MKKLLILIVIIATIASCNSQHSEQLQSIDLETVSTMVIGKDVQLIDVRTSKEYNAGHIDDAMNIDVLDDATFTAKIQNLDKEKPVYLYCQKGARSKRAGQKLKEMGFKSIFDYSGGYSEWSKQTK